MSRLRMVSGMAAAGAGAAKGPALAVCGFVRTVLCAVFGALWVGTCAVGRAAKAILPVLLVAGLIGLLSYLGYLLVCNWIAQAAIAAEATRHETAFKETLEAAADEAEDLEINGRIQALVGSRLATSGESVPGSDKAGELSSLEGVPDEPMEYRELVVVINSPRSHTVKLTAMRSISTGREYVSVEVGGELAYMCAIERDEYGERKDLWPWVYKGIGLWEHLLEQIEVAVDTDRQQEEIDARFGNLEEGK